MSSDTDDLMVDLDRCLAVRDEDGHVVLQTALVVTLYFVDPYRRDVREAVVSCCEDYFRWCGAHLRWAVNPVTRLPERYEEGKGSLHPSWLLERGEHEGFSFIYHGADHERGASAFHVRALGGQRRPYEVVGYFKASFPLLWFAEDRGSLSATVLDLCNKLRPLSGYSGIGLVESPDSRIASRCEPVVYVWAQRFPGLEVDYPISHSIWLTDGREGGRGGIKGVNWLTVVGDRWLHEIGGAAKVEADLAVLDGRYAVHRFDGGVLVQAGPRPQLGDAEQGRWPELYVKLSKYLRPIRISRHRPFHSCRYEPCFDLERSQAWLRRFDER